MPERMVTCRRDPEPHRLYPDLCEDPSPVGDAESGALSAPRTGLEPFRAAERAGDVSLAFLVSRVRTQAFEDLRSLLSSIEDAGRQGALDPDRLETQRLVDLTENLRRRYPE